MGKLIRLELFSMTTTQTHSTQSLTVIDFKSYKGHHVLLFGDAYFTSIIGPNGSGKSNSFVPLLLSGRITR
jgi:structural maintenance of chromosome 1